MAPGPLHLLPSSTEEPEEWREQAEAIARSVRQIQHSLTDPRRPAPTSRDVHVKHHGLVQGKFIVGSRDQLTRVEQRADAPLGGVFSQPEREYLCWIRFSSSSKIPRSDDVPDGRGAAIKLVGVEGNATALPGRGGTAQAGVQDFVLVNGRTFFAAHAKEMIIAADLEARDRFPSDFFVTRPRGLSATLEMLRSQAASPLELTYFSQTPYQLGSTLAVKYRIRPLEAPRDSRNHSRGEHHLREALQKDLARGNKSTRTFEFAVQLALDDGASFPLDDATVVWDETASPFLPVARIEVPGQNFVHPSRVDLAERMEFNPFNALDDHRPLGSINFARGVAYAASQKYRRTLNQVPSPRYDVDEWNREQTEGQRTDLPVVEPAPVTKPSASGRILEGLSALVPGFWEKVLEWGQLKRSYFLVLALLVGLLAYRYHHPSGPIGVDFASALPSEKLIPQAVWTRPYRDDEALRTGAQKSAEFLFQYAPTGTEYDGGVPYWVFRALPRIAPEYFGGRTDYRVHGFDQLNRSKYFESYHDLPRGLVLSDTVVHVLGNDLKLTLKRVSFNCATCHSGEYQDKDGFRRVVDGMPANVVDTVGYKTAFHRTVRDPRFSTENLLEAINAVLAEEAAKQGAKEPAHRLTVFEELVYAQIGKEIRKKSLERPLDWMDRRPENGPGRVDAFGALRFEYLGYPDEADQRANDQGSLQNSVVDLPSIWNQRAAYRPYHHWDGNTKDLRARNFGAIIGVGGTPWSVHQKEVGIVGRWIDVLSAPKYPFEPRPEEQIQAGHELFEQHCAACHGQYDEGGKLVHATECMREPIDVGTDADRFESVDEAFVERLNRFGQNSGLWGGSSFRPTQGYLCPPLDGIWARAPYLHNGSVPTLEALLMPEKDRPKDFFRGNTAYDQRAGGFLVAAPEGDDKLRAFRFVTKELDPKMVGNSSAGHQVEENEFSDEERQALIAYLYTL